MCGIVETDKLISLFMKFSEYKTPNYIEQSAHNVKGLEFYSRINNGGRQGSWEDCKNMKFSTSWDWLIPVVQKISQLLNDKYPKQYDFYFNSFSRGLIDIELMYIWVIKFIKWYNEQKI